MLTGFDLCRAAMAVTDVSAPEQSVLLVLAVMANDQGQCWPAIEGPSGLTGKTKLCRRAVQNAVKSLVAAGHLQRLERAGRGVVYTVTPRTTCTGAQDARAQEMRRAGDAETPAPGAPKQPVSTIPSKASPPKVKRLGASDYPMPDGVDPQHWQDFLANRKRKQLPNTRTAHAKLLRDLEKFADDEWPPPRILQHAAERGWAGIYDPRNSGHRNGQRPRNDRPAQGFGDPYLAHHLQRGGTVEI